MKNVVGLFDNMQDAEAVVRDLRDAGVADADISFAGRNQDTATTTDTGDYVDEGRSEVAEGAGFGATGGTVVGGLTGLLVGLGALAIPGVGPVIAAGSLATALGSAALGAGIGAATGGLLGALVGAGIPEEDANLYSEGIRRGGALVMARVDDNMVDTALDIMERHNVVDIDERGSEYRQGGWSRFDTNAEPYTTSAARTGAAVAEAGAAGTNFERPATDTTAATTDTTSTTTGDADRAPGESDYARSSKIGTAGGAVAGAATGAAIGSVGGPVGTVVGGVAGAVAGGGVGAVGDAAGVAATDDDRGRATDYDRRDMSSESYGSTTDTAYRGGTNDPYATRDMNDPSYSTSGAGFGAADTRYDPTGTGARHRSRMYDAIDTRGTAAHDRSVGEGAVESTASRIENATERGLNADLDRDGDVGRRDPRNNY